MPVQRQIEIKSDDLREFINSRPSALVRMGVPILFFIFIFFVIGSWFIQYPDTVNASARINSINGPKPVLVLNGGRLVKLLKMDGDEVQENDIIGFIESTADHTKVLKLSIALDTLQYFADNFRLAEIPNFWESFNSSFNDIGELQQSHQSFIQDYLIFKNYLNKGVYVTKKHLLFKDLNNTEYLAINLKQQKDLQEQDLELYIKNFNVHDTLHNETLLSDLDFRVQKSQLLNKKMSIPQINALIINNSNHQNSLRKEILELENQIVQQKTSFVQSIKVYRSIINEWKKKYLLTCPVKGKLMFTNFIEENQFLQPNQIVCYIISPNEKYYVEMFISQVNFGKVKKGQDVLLKFPSYPEKEFGSVRGKIETIKSIPVDSGYLAKINLPNGLVTNFKKNIFYTEGLIAKAQIITKKRRLSDRFIAEFKNLIK